MLFQYPPTTHRKVIHSYPPHVKQIYKSERERKNVNIFLQNKKEKCKIYIILSNLKQEHQREK